MAKLTRSTTAIPAYRLVNSHTSSMGDRHRNSGEGSSLPHARQTIPLRYCRVRLSERDSPGWQEDKKNYQLPIKADEHSAAKLQSNHGIQGVPLGFSWRTS